MERKKLKVQSVFEPSGPPSRSLFRFPRSMRRLGVSWLPPEWEILVIAKLPRSISLSFTDNSPLTLLLQGVKKYYESIVPCTRTQSSTTYVAFQLSSDKNNSQKSLLLFLGKAIFLPHIFLSLWIGTDIPNIYMKINTLSINSSKWTFSPHFRDTYTFRLLHLYAMFEIWLSIHVPCFHIRQKTIAKLECKSPVKCYTYKQSEFLTKRRRNQTVFHQNLPNILQNSIRWIKYISLIYWCNNLRIARRRPLFTA